MQVIRDEEKRDLFFIQEELREMAALKTKTRKPNVDIQAINMTCHCGGFCVNDRGSTMLEETDLTATCEECGENFPLLKKYFVYRQERTNHDRRANHQ